MKFLINKLLCKKYGPKAFRRNIFYIATRQKCFMFQLGGLSPPKPLRGDGTEKSVDKS